MSLSHSVVRLVESGGLIAVFVLMFAESCGIPAPSEVIMPFAGAFAAAGHLSLPGSILAGALGNLGGSLLAWGLAARYGEPLLLGPGRRIGLRPSHLASADHWFARHGLLAVFFGRLLPVVRTYISFPAGLARVEPIRFSLLTFAGALPWCAALAVAGYQVRDNYDRISRPIEYGAYVLAALIAAALVVWFVRVRRSAGRGAGTV
ncbi:MAG: DedA family protein [Candidatus Dormibacteria bacterium]